jgi:hypothetical protein
VLNRKGAYPTTRYAAGARFFLWNPRRDLGAYSFLPGAAFSRGFSCPARRAGRSGMRHLFHSCFVFEIADASASSFDCTISDQSLTRAQPLQFVQLLPRGLFHVRFLRDKAQLTKTVVIASISSLGVIQPLLVRPNCDGYKVIVGQRRLLACRAPWPDLKSPLLKSDAGERCVRPLSLIDLAFSFQILIATELAADRAFCLIGSAFSYVRGP